MVFGKNTLSPGQSGSPVTSPISHHIEIVSRVAIIKSYSCQYMFVGQRARLLQRMGSLNLAIHLVKSHTFKLLWGEITAVKLPAVR